MSCFGLPELLFVSISITSVGEDRAVFLLSFTCNFVVSVQKSFLFVLVLGKGCIILL